MTSKDLRGNIRVAALVKKVCLGPCRHGEYTINGPHVEIIMLDDPYGWTPGSSAFFQYSGNGPVGEFTTIPIEVDFDA